MSTSQENRLIREFSKLKTKYLDLESTNQMLLQKIMHLSERLKFKEEQRSKLIKMCSEKISKKNDTIESLKSQNQHLQDIIHQQNQQIMEQDKTIERLKNSTNNQTIVVKHPCFEGDKVKTKKEQKKKPFQVRYPNLNITLNRRTINEPPELINGNRQRRKLYSNDDETVDLSN